MNASILTKVLKVSWVSIFILASSTVGWSEMLHIKVENLSPGDGTRMTPVWVGFHDGSFDAFDAGSAASGNLQMLAEDGDPSGISGSFTGQVDGVVLGPVTVPGQPPIYHPGEVGMLSLDVDTSSDVYFSFLSMVIPSNDAFIGNDNPMAWKIVDNGMVTPLDIVVMGSMVWDAGTEVNDEVPANTPLLGQAAPDTGLDENGLVRQHGGYLVDGNVLNAFPGADFTASGYQVARITVVPEPASIALIVMGALSLNAKRLRRKQSRTH